MADLLKITTQTTEPGYEPTYLAGGVLEKERSEDFIILPGTAAQTIFQPTTFKLTDIDILRSEVSKLEKELDEIKRANKPHLIVLREISREDAKKEILGLLDNLKGEQIYPSDIADKLSIDFLMVMDILDELEKEEEIEVVNSE
ncbi:hypothetical protein BEH94_04160 [Candidatus Altiarchaeales archaeon WOR_SM1_SCG]|nr:hypothetical protein BEH94_04160 [Candidatus Altiarchaeales archaeon WOR_SM1_SCG]